MWRPKYAYYATYAKLPVPSIIVVKSVSGLRTRHALCFSCMDKKEVCAIDVKHTMIEVVPQDIMIAIKPSESELELFLRSSIEDEMPVGLSDTQLSSPRRGVKEFIW